MDQTPFLGHGVGLRRDHYQRICSEPTRCDWFEVISENYMRVGGRARAVLDKVRSDYPIILHGVSLSIGSSDPLNESYLKDLADLAAETEPAWVSDHLCWTGTGGHNAHDLLPIPHTEEALGHVVDRIRRVKDKVKRPFAIENVSSYMAYNGSQMPEWEFLTRIAEGADCGLLFDVNNIYVSGQNHGFDPREYMRALPGERIYQIHLAGHSDIGTLLLDTHDHAIIDPVWQLYEETIERFGPVSTLIEWDDHIPPFERLEQECLRAGEIHKRALQKRTEPVVA